MNPLRHKVILKCGKKKTDYSSKVESFTYIDEANGASDSISVNLSNIDGRWSGKKMPHTPMKMMAKIRQEYENDTKTFVKTFTCGTFYLDDMEFQGYPSVAVFGAVSDPVSQAFKNTKRSRTWKNATLKQICSDISKKYKSLTIYYDAPTIKLTAIEQNKQTDSSFLNSITDKYGCGMKIFANKIVVYSIEKYEKKKSVKTITEKMMEPGWTYNTSINGNYTGVKLVYKNSKGTTIKYQAGNAKRLLAMNDKVDNKADAMKVALARVNKENASTNTLRFTLREPAFLSSTSCITIKGLGSLSGKYFITRVRHVISNGYKVSIECRKVTKRIGG